MYSKKLFIFLSLIFCSISAYSQHTVGGTASKGMDMNTMPYGTIQEVISVRPSVKGSYYLQKEWQIGTIELYQTEYVIENISVRYNLLNEVIEIKDGNTIRAIDSRRIKKFSIGNKSGGITEFYHGRYFLLNNTPLTGMLELVESKPDVALYRRTTPKLINGSYVAVLDMGNEHDEIVKNHTYYLESGGDLLIVNNSKTQFSRQFDDKKRKVKEKLKMNNINLNNVDDLIEMLDFIGEYL